jgi:type III restriction enzyme
MSHRHRLPDPFEPDVLVGGPELVRHLGMSRRSFYDAIERGSVPAPTARIGGRRKWRGDVLNAWARAGYPAQLMYLTLADMACERITRGIVSQHVGECPIKAVLDPYNPTGSTSFVNFNTSKKDRWQTDARRCHINWVILDSDWEAEFCRVAEAHPKVVAYVKNHNLGLDVPYRYGSESRKYRPDFIVLVDDGREPAEDGTPDLLRLVVEIKGYRREDAKEKAGTMRGYWIPGVNNLKTYGRWAFAEFCDVYEMEADFEAKVEEHFNSMIDEAIRAGNTVSVE